MLVRRLCQGVTAALMWLALASPVGAATVTISWDPNPEPDVTNYNVYVRTQFGTNNTFAVPSNIDRVRVHAGDAVMNLSAPVDWWR